MSYIVNSKIFNIIENSFPNQNDKLKAYRLINQIEYRQFFDGGKNKFAFLSSNYLKKHYGNNYNDIIKTLVNSGLIIRKPYNRELNQCFGYRINKKFIDWNDLHLIDEKVIKNYTGQNKKVIHDLSLLSLDINGILHSIEIFQIDIKQHGGYYYYKDIRNKNNRLYNSSKLSEFIWNHTNECKLSLCKSIINFYDKKFTAKRNQNVGRLFTNLTNLKKIFIPYITLFGEPLMEIDIKNCQPALMSYLLTDINFIKSKFPFLNDYKIPAIQMTDDVIQFINDCNWGYFMKRWVIFLIKVEMMLS